MISFGPIPSRRLGKSLGINNILSPKMCSYGCIYCQVGKTKKQSIERQVFYQPEVIRDNVTAHLKKLVKDNDPDYLTFVSNGEPTLDINLGKMIKMLRPLQIPIAVISNASLLYCPDAIDDLLLADWVSLKVDAGDRETWEKINKPHPKLDFEMYKKSLFHFAEKYKGILCTETMLVKSINDSSHQINLISEIVAKVSPTKAYISIPTRPPAFSKTEASDIENVHEAWQIFSNKGLKTEIIIGFEGTNTGFTGNAYDDILNITAVHPLRDDVVAELLKKDQADFSVVESLLQQELIKLLNYKNNTFYIRNYLIEK